MERIRESGKKGQIQSKQQSRTHNIYNNKTETHGAEIKKITMNIKEGSRTMIGRDVGGRSEYELNSLAIITLLFLALYRRPSVP